LNELEKLLFIFVLPIITLTVILTLTSPDLNQINFKLSSMDATTGGYGPNQISTILGAGIFIIGLAYLMGFTITPYFWGDLILLTFLTIRGFLTFSRGGMFGAAGALILSFFVLNYKGQKGSKKNFITALIVIGGVGLISWNIINQASGGKLSLRYQGETYGSLHGPHEVEFTTGRLEILKKEMSAFSENPILGIGPGMSQQYQIKTGKFQGEPLHMAHTEFSRLMAQHGIFGLIFLFIVIITPLKRFFTLKTYSSIWIAGFVGLAFLTMGHSATRLAMVGFFYGLGFVIIKNDCERNLLSSK
jgi:hypothetical protein